MEGKKYRGCRLCREVEKEQAPLCWSLIRLRFWRSPVEHAQLSQHLRGVCSCFPRSKIFQISNRIQVECDVGNLNHSAGNPLAASDNLIPFEARAAEAGGNHQRRDAQHSVGAITFFTWNQNH